MSLSAELFLIILWVCVHVCMIVYTMYLSLYKLVHTLHSKDMHSHVFIYKLYVCSTVNSECGPIIIILSINYFFLQSSWLFCMFSLFIWYYYCHTPMKDLYLLQSAIFSCFLELETLSSLLFLSINLLNTHINFLIFI